MNTYPGMDVSRPVILKPASGFSATIRTSPAASAGVIRFAGVKYFTIDGSNNGTSSRDLTIKFQSNLATTSAVIVINPSATITSDNITIKNCNIVGYSTNTTSPTAYGIYLGGTTVPSVPSIGQNDSNNFENNYIQAVNFGIYLRGLATGNRDNLNRVVGNLIGGTVAPNGTATDSMTYVGFATVNAAGVWFTGQNNLLIDSNEIRNHISNTAYGFSGIFSTTTGQFNTNITISRNRIHDLTYLGTGGWGEYGMRLNVGSSTLQNFDIFNNQIWNIRSDGFSGPTSTFNPNGIMLEGTSANANINLYYNSINLYGTSLNAGASSALWVASGITGGVRMVNNIFSNSYGGTATAGCHAVTLASTTAMPFTVSNYNIYFANSATSINRFGWLRGAGVTTQTAFISATTGTGLDANSFFTNPNYVSNTDLTVNGLPAMAAGTPITTPTFSRNISTDIRNFTRDIATPSIGSFEVPLAPMNYDSTTATQITSAIIAGNTNQAILRIKVSVTGAINPLNVSKLSFTTNGSTNPLSDIDSAKVFYTAANPVFSPINKFGSNVLSPNGLFQVTGSRNLQFGDNYFWLVYDVKSSATLNNVLDATYDSITIAGTNYLPSVSSPAGARTILGAMAGNYNVGVGQVYSSITNALTDLYIRGVSAPVTFTLLDTTYNVASGETFPLTLSSYSNASAVNTVTFRPGTGVTAEIVNTSASPVFSFNGGRFFRIDGRQNSQSNPKSLTVRSDNTGGNALFFINDASDNIISHANLLGNNTAAAAGVINFSTGLINGNDNNTIDSCNIGNSSSIPVTIINSLGSSTNAQIQNSNNVISNNEIFNFWNATGESNAFKISNGNTDWTITGNHIYQTAPRTATTGLQHYIWNLNKGGNANALNNMTITNNIIGGSQINAGGTPYTVSGTVAVRFTGAYLDMGTITPSLFQNNTYTNFSWTTNDVSTIIPGTWNAIWSVNGITSILNNTIGSMNSNDAIVITSNSNGGVSFPIGATGTSAGLVNISGNNLGGIRTQSSSTVNGVSLIPIAVTGSTTTYNISNNTIGGILPASLHVSNPSTATTQTFSGIQYGSSATSVINNNTLRNIRNSYAGIAGGGVTGIQNNNGGALSITNNRIFNMYGTANNPGTVIFGIRMNSTTAGQNITGNTIYNLVMDSANNASSNVSGIWYSGPASGSNIISGNFIHSFNHLSNNRAASFTGINMQAGNAQLFNNMIRLGYDSSGAVVTNGYAISGISEIAGTNDYFHNTVYVGGAGIIDSSNTAAFVSTSTSTSARNIRNNIFVNERSNTGSVAKNYVIRIANSTGLVSNNNIFRAAGNGALYGSIASTDFTTFSAWKTTSLDGSSTSADTNFVNKSAAASLVDLHVQSPTPVEGNGFAITSVTTDFDGQLRANFTATDIGADAGNFVGLDVIPPTISYTNLNSTGIVSNRILSVTITDASSVFVSGVNRPRIYYKKMSFGTYVSDTGILVSGNGFNGIWNFTINPSNVGGLIAGDSLYYYVIAQDSSLNANIGSNPGGVE
ncbi:MAG: beta strand repeat-containing protein, partial [Dolichospermum sp.]